MTQGLNCTYMVFIVLVYVHSICKYNNSYHIQIECQIIQRSYVIHFLPIFTAYFSQIFGNF